MRPSASRLVGSQTWMLMIWRLSWQNWRQRSWIISSWNQHLFQQVCLPACLPACLPVCLFPHQTRHHVTPFAAAPPPSLYVPLHPAVKAPGQALPSVPTGIAAASAAKTPEELELEALQAEMAL